MNKLKQVVLCLAITSCVLFHPSSQLFAQAPSLINYQGRLVNGTNLVNGTVELSLRLYNVNAGGSILCEDSNSVAVADGLYSTYIGDNTTSGSLMHALTNSQVWLEVVVDGVALAPRERLVSVPFALHARGVEVATNFTVTVGLPGSSNRIDAGASGSLIGGGRDNIVYSIDGFGLSSDSAIQGGRGHRLIADHSVIGGGLSNSVTIGSYSVISGGEGNQINAPSLPGSLGSVVAGGRSNSVDQASGSAIGGGENNSIAFSLRPSVIAGGLANTITGASFAAIGGGNGNLIEGADEAVVIGGGENLIASGSTRSVIAGGGANTIGPGALYSFIAGGVSNYIGPAAWFGFAAGYQAQALHKGAFVWADYTDGAFKSTGTNQFLIRARGGVGIGTDDPLSALHVRGDDPSGSFSGQLALSGSLESGVSNSGAGIRLLGHDGNIPRDWAFIRGVKANSTIGNTLSYLSFGTRSAAGTLTERMRLDTGGLTVNGTFVSSSDRNRKQDIKPVDGANILELVSGLEVHTWRYKDDPEVLHIGPMAQDFHAAFRVGPDERHIASVDADGVALAAIQALAKEKQRLEEKVSGFGAQVSELEEENRALHDRLDVLEKRLGL